MPKPTPEETLNDRLQEEIESLRNHNTELLAELKAAKTAAKQMTTQVETLTIERDQALTTLADETVSRPVRALLERVSPLPDHFEAEFKKRGYRFVRTDGGIQVHDAGGKPAQVQDSERGAPRDCTFTAADIGALVLERWKPEGERHASANAFAHLVIAPHVAGGGAPPGGRAVTVPAPTPAQPSPPALGLR